MNNSYLFVCNPSKYDLLLSFIKNGFVDFSTYQNLKIGDIVYIYITAPYSALLFKCQVKDVLNYEESINDSEFNKGGFNSKNKCVRLIPIKSYLENKNAVSQKQLESIGIKGFNFQLKLSDNVINYLENV